MTRETTAIEGGALIHAVEEYTIEEEPYYLPIGDEIELFEAAYDQRIPVLLKGPTGAGKTRFVEYMAFRLGRPFTKVSAPLRRRDRAARVPHHGRLP
jgi:nitric oxide reductase NorQ protein